MKKIVIMGATSGIGLQVAERLAAEGMRLGIAGRNEEVLRQMQRKYPGRIVWSRIDITDDDAVERFHDLVRRLGGMDVYLHVSGIGFTNTSLDMKKELDTVQTNVAGFTRMVDAAFRYFRDERAGVGHIAAVTSVAGTNGLGELASYSSSKRYQQTYLRALQQLSTIQKLHIRFTDIRPGWIRTPLLDSAGRYPMLMKLPYAAGKVVKALRGRRRVAVVDWRWNIVAGLWRLVPNALWVRLPLSVRI